MSWHGQALSLGAQLGYRFEPHRTLFTAVYDDHVRLLTGLSYAPKMSTGRFMVSSAPRSGRAALALSAQAGVALQLQLVRVPVSGYSPLSSRPGQPAGARPSASLGVTGAHPIWTAMDCAALPINALKMLRIVTALKIKTAAPTPTTTKIRCLTPLINAPLRRRILIVFRTLMAAPTTTTTATRFWTGWMTAPMRRRTLMGILTSTVALTPIRTKMVSKTLRIAARKIWRISMALKMKTAARIQTTTEIRS